MDIFTKKDLEDLAYLIQMGEVKTDAKLHRDIDLTEMTSYGFKKSWEAIGRSDRPYMGTFDGNGHTISGLYINGTGDNEALFRYVKNGCIKNLIVKGSVKGRNRVAGIVSEASGTEIINCNSYVNCLGLNNVGGICGYVSDYGDKVKISECTNYGKLEAHHPHGIVGAYVGNRAKVTNCRNEGDLSIHQFGTLLMTKEYGFRYDQIGGITERDGSNKLNGKVITPFRRDLLGMCFSTYIFGRSNSFTLNILREWLGTQTEPHCDDNGNTYLHLICQNPNMFKRNNLLPIQKGSTTELLELVALLAAETTLDFGAVNKDGKEAAAFLKDANGKTKRGFAKVLKLIETVKKDKDRIGTEPEYDSFSDIGF